MNYNANNTQDVTRQLKYASDGFVQYQKEIKAFPAIDKKKIAYELKYQDPSMNYRTPPRVGRNNGILNENTFFE